MLNLSVDRNSGVRRLRIIKFRATACATFLGLLFCLGFLTSCGSAPSAPPSQLTVSPTTIEITSSSCSVNNTVCRSIAIVRLRNIGQSDLHWSATAQTSTGWSVAFTPAEGTLMAGQAASVQISFNGGACPTGATLKFTGPANTVAVQWNCAETNQP